MNPAVSRYLYFGVTFSSDSSSSLGFTLGQATSLTLQKDWCENSDAFQTLAKVTVTAPGFQQYNSTDIVLNVNDRRVIDVTLAVGAKIQTVDVLAASEAINLETATPAELMTGNEIRELG